MLTNFHIIILYNIIYIVFIGLSTRERSFSNEYNKVLSRLMRAHGGIDITQNLTPPKSLYAEVICQEDAGDLDLESGKYPKIYSTRKNRITGDLGVVSFIFLFRRTNCTGEEYALFPASFSYRTSCSPGSSSRSVIS